MTKSPTRKPPPQPSQQPQQYRRNVYDYDGEYEFPTVQHWTAPDVPAPPTTCSIWPALDLARTISLVAKQCFCQSFINTGAGFFFRATGAAVSSDGSLLGGTGAAVSSDGSLLGGTVAVVSSDGSLFDGTGAVVGFDGFVFGATDTDARSVGRGRGNGISDAAGNERCGLVSVPVTRVNQVETSCAISDRVDRGSVRAGDGACAFADAAASVTRNKEYVVAFRSRTCTVSVRNAPNSVSG
jgi:hypothetical protein